ncbi:hypothetical protein ACFLQ2_02305 [archaeon]
MKGFMGTAAAMLFAFSLVTAGYSFMLSQSDLSYSSMAGPVVESTRWAAEAELFECATTGDTNFNGDAYKEAIGMNLVGVNGNASTINNYGLGSMKLSVHLERDYSPTIHLKPGPPLQWTVCDTEADSLTFTLSGDLPASAMSIQKLLGAGVYSYTPAPGESGTYWISGKDSTGTVYSNKVTVTAAAAPTPTAIPTAIPTAMPTGIPTAFPTAMPTVLPTAFPPFVPFF